MTFDFLPSMDALPKPGAPDRAETGLLRWEESLASLDPEIARDGHAIVADPAGQRLLEAIFGNSPFLSRSLLSDIGFFVELVKHGERVAFDRILRELRETPISGAPPDSASRALRVARRRAALAIALADIANRWTLHEVTGALSDFAEAAMDMALAYLLRQAAELGEIDLADPENPLTDCGYVALGMGKLGARELNYSSDVDLIVLYDPDRISYRGHRGLSEGMVRLTRDLIALLEERTSDGYVLRTDLRLRPDPGAMPLAISVGAARTYYETIGQNWERAAMVKARPCCGDRRLGDDFLHDLRPFIWRKNLDFWAIQDIHSIKRQIQAQKGGKTVAVEGHNIKLGRGGIREIEFFAQTQQLIFGGRDPSLRTPRTLDALQALVAAGRLSGDTATELTEAYGFLRGVEHRLQMVDDQQTHSLPKSEEGVAEIAAFLGYATPEAFRQDLLGHLRKVEDHYAELFEEAPPLASPGNLVFTGGEPEPATLETLAGLGFKDGETVFNVVRAWHHGRHRATRSERARQILTELMPSLLEELGKTREPDQALARLDTFIKGLPAGVQLFSLLFQNPRLLELLAAIMGRAPALAERLARNPGLLDAVLDPAFSDALPGREEMQAELKAMLAEADDFQDNLDISRRWANDRRFRIGVQILRGAVDSVAAGTALSNLADAVIRELHPPVLAEFARSHGAFPGPGLAVIGLGNLGSQRLTYTSDLDLVFVYEAAAGASQSDGPKPLDPTVYFGRLAQREITALTAMTGEGRLFEVDVRLRPSGDAGPIATSLPAYERYLLNDAWTWEHMALTRARILRAEAGMAERLAEVIHKVLTQPRDTDRLLIDVADMRERIDKEYPAKSLWNVKYLRGGLYDLDFIAQYLQLRHAAEHPEILRPSTREAFEAIGQAGLLPAETADFLIGASALLRDIQSFLRLTVGNAFDETQAPEGLKAALAKATGQLDFASLRNNLMATAEGVMNSYAGIIDTPARHLRAIRGETGASAPPNPSQTGP